MAATPAVPLGRGGCAQAGKNPQSIFNWINEAMEICTDANTIIFANRRDVVHALGDFLRSKDHTVGKLTGANMDKNERDRTVKAFREGVTNVLITTNVVARGPWGGPGPGGPRDQWHAVPERHSLDRGRSCGRSSLRLRRRVWLRSDRLLA